MTVHRHDLVGIWSGSWRAGFALAACCWPMLSTHAAEPGLPETLQKSLTFAATFDKDFDADFARGDRKLYSSAGMDRKNSKAGLSGTAIERLTEGGRAGGALRFSKAAKPIIYYQVKDNLAYSASDEWSGTISYYLSVDPEKDLLPSYTDPIQITERMFNDAAIWCDFTLDKPRKFRLGVIPDLKVWNPENADFEKLAEAKKPTTVVGKPPFATGKWTHVVIVFEHFNTGKPDGDARLYLDGELQGHVKGWNMKYTWDPEKAAIFVGIAYSGMFDDLLLFNRALTAAEVQQFTELGRAGHSFLGR